MKPVDGVDCDVFKALSLFIYDPLLLKWLREKDPMALEQVQEARNALITSGRIPVNLPIHTWNVDRSDQTKALIIKRIAAIETELSPEWLTCDGELPIAQIRRKEKALLKRRAELVKELGYEPSFKELYPNG